MEKHSELFAFLQLFNSDEACRQVLFDTKWKNGYQCRRCGCREHLKGKTQFHMRCRSCYYDESSTAHTLFHKLKFPITKAFAIIFQIATMKKGISNCEVARQFGIQIETAWFFRKRIRIAMSSALRRNHDNDFNEILMIFKNIASQDAQEEKIDKASKKKTDQKPSNAGIGSFSFRPFKRKRRGNTNQKAGPEGYSRKNRQIISKVIYKEKRGNRDVHFVHLNKHETNAIWPEFDVLNLKNWLIGIHHKASVEHLQGYFNEFHFRLRNRLKIFRLPLMLIRKFVELPKAPYRTLIAT
jgi:hypothetical protein